MKPHPLSWGATANQVKEIRRLNTLLKPSGFS